MPKRTENSFEKDPKTLNATFGDLIFADSSENEYLAISE